MSRPISYCRVVKAVHDEDAYQLILKDMAYNRSIGIWSQIPCGCSPQCQVTEDELASLNERMSSDLLKIHNEIHNEIASRPQPKIDIGAAVISMTEHMKDADWGVVQRALRVLNDPAPPDSYTKQLSGLVKHWLEVNKNA
jgi:hypothetical protein